MAVLPRDLHPGAWWVWALGLAAAASSTTNPVLLVLLVLVRVHRLALAERRCARPSVHRTDADRQPGT